MITMESFGSNLPDNWEAIAADINRIIEARGIDGDTDAENELWDDYCSCYDDGIWYAVQTDPSDDWGTGSFYLPEAKRLLRECLKNNPGALIAVIENNVCIREIRI